jgi:poly-beta-1,6-N-acetyl-D-glucosamine biosynthesis protein PgaD
MNPSVIIEASDRLAWHRRLASDASTAALWGGWLWLWAPLVKGATQLVQLWAQMPRGSLKALAAAGPSLPLAAIAGASGTLVAWRSLPRRRAQADLELPLSAYASRFDLPEAEIAAGREASICVVHHDADGRIARIERREPAVAVAAA